MSTLSNPTNIIALRRHAVTFGLHQPVICPDPDCSDAAGRPIFTEGLIVGFDEKNNDIFVILDGESEAARRFKDWQLTPV